MSLFSSFYIGELEKIGRLLKAGDYSALETDPSVTVVDFSGGLVQPFLSLEDFKQLIDPVYAKSPEAKATCRTLLDARILAENGCDCEQAAYIVSSTGMKQICSLPESSLVEFNRKWNEDRAGKFRASVAKNSIWRSRRFWTLVCGLSLGLSLGAVKPPRAGPLILLGALLPLVLLFAWRLERRRHSQQSDPPIPVDWTPRLISLQMALNSAAAPGTRAVYYHSL